MQDCQLTRAISVQRGRWQSSEDREASSLYHKRLNKGYDYQAAECLAGPLGPCRYEVQNLTAEICDNILPAGKVLNPWLQEILTAAVIWASKDAAASDELLPDVVVIVVLLLFKYNYFLINSFAAIFEYDSLSTNSLLAKRN